MAIGLTRAQQDTFICDNHSRMTRANLSAELNLTDGQVSGRIRVLRSKGLLPACNRASTARQAVDSSEAESPTGTPTFTRDVTDKAQVLTSVHADIKTLDDLLAHAEVDLSVWEVDHHKINKWEGFAKNSSRLLPNGDRVSDLIKTDLWQVQAWLRRKTGLNADEFRLQLFTDIVTAVPPRKAVTYKAVCPNDRFMYEIAIPDLHLGKLAWDEETGENYDTDIAADRFMAAIEYAIGKAKHYPIEGILLPVGNDFLHADARNMTVNGTVQDVDSRWQRSFIRGRKLLTTAIDRLREVAPVNAIIVPGNHDRERIFYLGDVVQAMYHQCKEVTVDNSPKTRKYVAYGINLIGLTHGDEEVHGSLPGLMALEEPAMWANSTVREFQIGHYHKRTTKVFTRSDTIDGVTVRIMPSLCSPDAWHFRKGYVGPKSADNLLWNHQLGLAGIFPAPSPDVLIAK